MFWSASVSADAYAEAKTSALQIIKLDKLIEEAKGDIQ